MARPIQPPRDPAAAIRCGRPGWRHCARLAGWLLACRHLHLNASIWTDKHGRKHLLLAADPADGSTIRALIDKCGALAVMIVGGETVKRQSLAEDGRPYLICARASVIELTAEVLRLHRFGAIGTLKPSRGQHNSRNPPVYFGEGVYRRTLSRWSSASILRRAQG
jgi:hypothetical protein